MTKWTARLTILLGSCWITQYLIHEKMGYRMDFVSMLTIASLMIVVVRAWMPWSDT